MFIASTSRARGVYVLEGRQRSKGVGSGSWVAEGAGCVRCSWPSSFANREPLTLTAAVIPSPSRIFSPRLPSSRPPEGAMYSGRGLVLEVVGVLPHIETRRTSAGACRP